MRRFVILTVALCCVLPIQGFGEDEGWTSPFNGKDLDGWEQKGGEAKYRVEGDAIVGSSVPNTGNSFLCTTRDYADFVFEFEFMPHPQLNSGVQIRSHSLADYRNGRVHGYQIELEENARDRDWSAGIYDEARRGWLYPKEGDEALAAKFGEQSKRIWKDDDWNHIRVEAVGDRIRTWLNGEPRADLTDDMTPSGFIALQVHGVGDRTEPMSISWRNIRIKEVKTDN